MVGRSAEGSAEGSLKRVTARSPRPRWYSVSRAAASAFMNRAPTSGSSRPRSTTVPSSSWWTCRARLACCRLVSRASALRSMQRQPRTIRSTCAAVPPRPTPSSRASVSGVATRVRARTLAYDSSPRARRLGQQRQRRQGARHADLLAGRAEVEADPPAQPVGAGAEPVTPAAAGIELADEVEEARGGGLEMRRQLGDLVAQPVQFRDGAEGHADGCRVDLHGEPPFYWGDSTPGFRSRPGALRTGDAGTSDDFSFGPARPPSTGPVRAAGPASTERNRHSPSYRASAVKRRMQAGRTSLECAEQRALRGLLGAGIRRSDGGRTTILTT